ncbi:YybH family protein [Hymenobacter baengnokdamensis]|uniref:YybH family protein n=1 Tax=Hymenobacter baengnokdamensis TaxID=2615203 RepID=UPI001248AEDA|nr:nuclear transport factor 2 family protein [Hymenobacter baengnokdamensis]
MRISLARFVLIGALPLLAACSKSAGTTATAATAADLDREFIMAWNNKDLEKTLGFLADDVQFLQGNAHFSGKAEVSDKWVRATQSSISNLKTSVVSSESSDKLAYEAGTFSVDVLPVAAGQPAGYGEGNFLLLWKPAADGTWKLSYAQLEDLPVQRRN